MHSQIPVIHFLHAGGVAALATLFLLRFYSGLKWKSALALTLVGTVGYAVQVTRMVRSHDAGMEQTLLPVVASLVAGLAIAAKLYRKWLAAELTGAERTPGVAGFRAWFSGANLVLGIVFSVLTAWAFHVPVVTTVILTFAVFALYPGIITLNAPELAGADGGNSSNNTAAPDIGRERDRVLRMLEEGKISPDDGADLLKALGAEAQMSPPQVSVPRQRFFLIGALLVLFGFLIPWLRVDVGAEMNRAVRALAMPLEGLQNQMMPTATTGGVIATVKGGDLEYGMGWIMLIAGLGTSMLWLFAPTIDPATKRTVTLVSLVAGGVILLYVVSSAFRFLSFGAPVTLVGYVLIGTAAFRRKVIPKTPDYVPAAATN